jgi:hypothetical protein
MALAEPNRLAAKPNSFGHLLAGQVQFVLKTKQIAAAPHSPPPRREVASASLEAGRRCQRQRLYLSSG